MFTAIYQKGDPAYPLISYCLREYTTCSSNAEEVFNNILHSSRNPAECAFERLKARCCFLKLTIALQLENVSAEFFFLLCFTIIFPWFYIIFLEWINLLILTWYENKQNHINSMKKNIDPVTHYIILHWKRLKHFSNISIHKTNSVVILLRVLRQ